MQNTRLSVALVTKDRPNSLRRCLESWKRQSIAPFEIVISDDSGEGIRPVIQRLAQEFGCVYTAGPRQGLYANRNHSSLTCRGTHILSADDDHTHPVDYVENILRRLAEDSGRVWVFTEKKPSRPESPLTCPGELHRSGFGVSPKDPSNCAAIADGSSVYPREIFDSGLRYDETYSFGSLWYLWGQWLKKKGWRISFSDSTFVWHHSEELLDPMENKLLSRRWLKLQLECTMYVLFVNAFWIHRSVKNIFWSFFYLLRRVVLEDAILDYQVRTRIGIGSVLKIFKNVREAGRIYHAV